MTLTQAVKADVGISTYRRRRTEVALATGCTGTEVDELIHTAAVCRQLSDLLPGNDVADFSRVRLHLDGVRFNRDALLRAAHLQLEVHTPAVADREHDIFLFSAFKVCSLGAH